MEPHTEGISPHHLSISLFCQISILSHTELSLSPLPNSRRHSNFMKEDYVTVQKAKKLHEEN